MVHTADESKVVVHGLDGYIVAENHGQLLVCELKEEQRIKEFIVMEILINKNYILLKINRITDIIIS